MAFPIPRIPSMLATILALLAAHCHAERAFVGVLEIDSIQSVNYGVTAFSRAASLPFVQNQVNAWLADNLLLPSTVGLSSADSLRIVQSVDTAEPLSPDNPANVVIATLADNGTLMRQAFADAYAGQKLQDAFTLFDSPTDTNRPPRVALAVSGRHLLASTSLPALAWAWENRAKLTIIPPLDLPGTFRALVNPQRFADIIGTRSEQADAFLDTGKLLRDLDSLFISVTLEGAAAAVSLRGTPKPDTALSALAATLRPTADTLWHAIPNNAFFTLLGAFDKPDLWSPFIGKAPSALLRPVTGHVPQTALTGEHLTYIAPTRDGKGLSLVQIEPVTATEPIQQAIRNLHANVATNSVTFTHSGQRQASGATIETYAISLPQNTSAQSDPATSISTLAYTALSLLLKSAVLEIAVTNGHLITVIGPPGAIDAHLPPVAFPAKPFTLNRRIVGQDPALNESLTLGSTLLIADLLRHTVSIIPEIKPEQVRLLPKGGNGAAFGICANGRTLTASLRLHSNEIAALQRLNLDGRVVLQEAVFKIFTKQMMKLETER